MATRKLLVACLAAVICAHYTEGRSRRAVDNCPTPPAPANGTVDCSAQDDLALDIYCIFTCKSGYKFQGVTETEYLFVCDIDRGFYDTPSTPPCVPDCNPPCLHGGTCIAPNTCQCKPPYYGDQCLHSRQLCNDPIPGRFGRMECQSDGNGGKICVPVCLPTFKFETPPPAQYVCGKDGTWFPDVTQIPDCIQEIDPQTTTTAQPAPTVGRISSDAICGAWGRNHFRTFDNKMYTFEGTCGYVMVNANSAYSIVLVNDPNCSPGTSCQRQVEIKQGADTILLSRGQNGPQVSWNGQVQSLPGYRDKSVFDQVGSYTAFRSSLGFEVKWDGQMSVFVKVSDAWKGKVGGLCGKYNGNPADDFQLADGQQVSSALDFGNSWKRSQGDACPDSTTVSGCGASAQAISRIQMADTSCADLFTDTVFAACHSVVDPNPYLDSCRDDCCDTGLDGCMCEAMEAYSRACANKGVKLAWRTQGRCEKSCSGGQVYKECGSTCVRDCTNGNGLCSDNGCVDGCFCPDGQIFHAGQCITQDQCPCEANGQAYNNGDTMKQQCNTCTCKAGSWDCTTLACDKTCSATGDPHYQTFDGKRYNFMGTCSYYLMKDRDFSIIVDNIKCGHGQNSCTKSISIDMNGLNIKLDHNHQLFVNGREITQLPYDAPGIKVQMVSSLFMQATLSNGVTILWDGRTRAYIKASSDFFGKTIGMCGTFDGNDNNDFKLLNGSVETNPNAFGNHWKTETSCSDMPLEIPPDPCEANPQVKAQATALCDQLKSDIFKDCFGVEDVTPYYDDCVYDLCACSDNMKDCMCPNIGSYADTCAAKGVVINWRLSVPECMIQCPPGQEYQVCGRPCERTCRDLSERDPDCNTKCVEGCNCPAGQTLSDEGICIPFTSCPCFFDGREYQAGFTVLMGQQICVCEGGTFNCATIDFRNVDSLSDTVEICEDNSVFTQCASPCRVTCENRYDSLTCSQTDCQPGCECVDGFVFHEDKCVNTTMCPCFHAGKAYYEGDSYTLDCNECKCLNHQWQCTQKDCPATCNAFGESHYTTYDGKEFEFQGACDYVLSQSIEGAGGPHKFAITARNSQCGTSGVTCFKQLEFTLGTEGTSDFYRLELIKGQTVIAEPGSPFQVQEIGEMVYVTTPFGISLQWDKNTRVYVRLSTDHMQKVEGLCGNFNRDETDDFTPRQGGQPLTLSTLFGDSWRTDPTCAPSQEITDTCVTAPQRKAWAQERCAVLHSDTFASCHALVDRAPFIKRCEFDACGCDLGGDCECVCTSIAAYAHECAIKGVPIKWRSNDLCPIECEECLTFNPCMSPCPKKTCENRLYYDLVEKDCADSQGVCFEGCDLMPCPEGQVYDSLTQPINCIPEALCETPACELNGKEYREGEKVDDPAVCRTSCEICICRGGTLEHISVGQCEPMPTPTPDQGLRTTATVSTTRSFNTLINPVCEEFLGLFSPDVAKDDQFTASTSLSVAYEAHQARLFNSNMGSNQGGAWVARPSDAAPFITIDLKNPEFITGVATQGHPDLAQWVTKYMVATSVDGVNFDLYMDSLDTVEKVFYGNFDSSTVVKAFFDREVPALAVRIYPLEWNGAAALRLDVLVCAGEQTTPGTSGTTMVAPPTPFAPSPDVVCNIPMNVDLPDLIPDSQLSASSSATLETSAPAGRLNNQYSAWVPSSSSVDQWHQVDFDSTVELSGVLTQGSPNSDRWVAAFTVSTSVDGLTYYPVRDDQGKILIYTGNSDRDSVMRNYFPHVIVARYVRLVPVTWGPEGFGLRVNYIGCFSTTISTPRPPVPFFQPQGIPTPAPSIGSEGTPTPQPTFTPGGVPTLVPPAFPTLEPMCTREMGLQSQRIVEDKQLTASSQIAGHGPEMGRITANGYQGSWIPAADDTTPYIQVDFKEPKLLAAIVSQGEGNASKWVTAYQVEYSENGVDFLPYSATQNGVPNTFAGNTDSLTPVTNYFVKNIIARFIRIIPTRNSGGVALRFDVLGCNPSSEDPTVPTRPPLNTPTLTPPTQDSGVPTPAPGSGTGGTPTPSPPTGVIQVPPPLVCLLPMGTPDRHLVRDDQITASSQLDQQHEAAEGRLYNSGSWIPGMESQSWIMLDLTRPTLVSGAVTQGSPDSGRHVKEYTVYVSLDGRNFIPYSDTPGGTTPYVFTANTDQTTPVRNLFNRDVLARYVRIVPLVASPQGIGLRFNIIGCEPSIPTQGVPTLKPPTFGEQTPTPAPGSGNTGQPSLPPTTEAPPCDVPMGIGNPRIIGDWQLSASSYDNINTVPSRGRIYSQKDGSLSGGWSPSVSNNDQYIQVDFFAPYEISGVVTQGRADQDSWVTQFAVYYSDDGISFHPVLASDGKAIVFKANSDRYTPVKNFFPTAVVARVIRIRPLGFQNGIGLRFELYGCDSPPPMPPTFVQGTPTPAPPVPSGATPTPRGCQFWSPWVSNSIPDPYAGELEIFFQTPVVANACTKDDVIGFECRLKDSKMLWDPSDPLVDCSPQDTTLMCISTPEHQCEDYEIRVLCDLCPLSTTRIPTDSTVPGQSSSSQTTSVPNNLPCTEGWSQWFNRDAFQDDGEVENMRPEELASFCLNGDVDDVSCVTADVNEMPWYLLSLTTSCDVAGGFVCDSGINMPAVCQDMKVQYHCSCQATTTPAATQTVTYPGTPTSVSTTFVTDGISTTTTKSTQVTDTVCVPGWSPWINNGNPTIGGGDYERLTNEELSKLCPNGEVTDIDCVESGTGDSWASLAEATCTLEEGLECTNLQLAGVPPCRDYKIRYMCNCSETTTPVPFLGSSGTSTPGPGSNSFSTPTPAPSSNSFRTPTPGPGSNSFGTPTPGPGSNSFGTPTPAPGSNSFGTPTPGPGSNSFGTPTPAPGSNSFGTPTPGPGSNSFETPTPGPGSNSFGTPTPGPGSNSFGTQTPAPGSNSFGTPTPGPGSNSFGTPTPGPGSNSFGTPTPAPGSNSFGTPTPGPGSNSFGTPTPGPGSNSFGTPTPGPGSNSFGTPTPGPGSNSFGTPTPAPGSNSFGTPTPGPGSNSFGTPTPGPGSNSFGTPTPAPGSNSFGTPTPGPGSNSFGTPTPAPGSNIFGTPTPGPGSNSFGTPTPGPGSNSFGTPTPAPGSNSFGTPTPGPGSNSFGTPTPGPGSNSFGTPTPGPGSNSFGTPTPAPGSNSFGTPTPGPGSNSFGTPTPGPGSNSFGTPTPAPGSNSFGTPTPGPGSNSFGTPTPGPGSNSFGTPTPGPGSNSFGTPTPAPGSNSFGTPTPGPGSNSFGTPTPGPDSNSFGSPTPAPGSNSFGTPTPGPGSNSFGTPTPAPGSNSFGTPTPGPGSNSFGTPTPGPGSNSFGTPTPGPGSNSFGTPTPAPGSNSFGTPTPGPGSNSFGTPTPGPGSNSFGTPTPAPGSNSFGTPTPGPGSNNFGTPTPGPGSNSFGTPTPGPGSNSFGTPTPAPGSNSFGTPTPGPGSNSFGTPTPGPGSNSFGTPTPAPGSNSFGTPTPGPGSNSFGTPTPAPGSNSFGTPTPGPGSNSFGTPTPGPDSNSFGSPTPAPGSNSFGTPTPGPGSNSFGTPTPAPGSNSFGTPTPGPGSNSFGTPTPGPGSNSFGTPTPAPGSNSFGTPTPGPGSNSFGTPTPGPGSNSFGTPTPAPGSNSFGTPTPGPGSNSFGTPTPGPGSNSFGTPTPAPGSNSFGTPTPGPGSNSFGTPTPGPGSNSFGTPTPAPGSNSFGTPTPGPGSNSFGTPTPAPGSNSFGTPTPGPGSNSFGTPTPGPGSNSFGTPTPAPGSNSFGTPTPGPGSNSFGTPTPAPGSNSFGTPTPGPGTNSFGTPTPGPGSNSFGTPTPAPGSNSFGTPTPGPGSNSFGTPTPGPGSNSFGTPTPAPGSNSFGTPTPGPGSNSFGTPTPAPGSNSFGTPTPGPGSNSFGTPTPGPGSNSFGTPTPAPGSNSFGTPTPGPGSNSFGTPTPAPGSNSFGTPTPGPGTNSFGTPTPGPGSNSFGTPTPAPGSNSFGTPTPGPGSNSFGTPTPGFGSISFGTPTPAPGSNSFGTPTPGPGSNSFGTPTPGPGSNSFGTPTPVPGSNSFGTPTPGPGSNSFGTPTPAPGSNSFGTPTPGPGSNSFGTPTPGPGSNSFGTPTPAPGSNSFGTPTPGPGSNSFGTPTPGPGSNSFGTPTPAPGSNSFGTPTPGPGSNSFGTPTPAPGSNSFGTPTPGPGSNSFGTPTPGPGSNSFGTPTPAPGSNSFGTPTPGPGSNSFGTPTPAPGSNSFGTPTPGPGSNSFGTPTPEPGSNSFGTPTPAPGSNSFGTPTPGPGSNSFGTPTPAPGSNSFGTPTPGPGSNSFGTPTPGPGSNSFGTPTPAPGSNSFGTPTPGPGSNSFGTPTPAPGSNSFGTPTPGPGTNSFGTPTPGPGSNSFGTPTPAPGSNSFGTPTPGPGSNSFGTPTPGFGSISFGTPTPAPGSNSFGTPTPGPGSNSFGTPTPGPGSNSFGTPTPVPGSNSFGTPTPGPGSNSFGTPTPAPGSNSFGTPTPGPGSNSFGTPTPGPGSNSFGTPTPAPGSNSFGTPTPGPGSNSFGTPTPGPGSNSFGTPTPAPGSNSFGTPTPGPGSNSFGTPTPAPGSNSFGTPTPGPGSNSFGTPTPGPGSNSFGTPTPAPGSNSFGTPTPGPGSNSFGTPTPAPGSNSFGTPTPGPGSNSFGTPTPEPGSNSFGTPTPGPGSNSFGTPTPAPGSNSFGTPSPGPGSNSFGTPTPAPGSNSFGTPTPGPGSNSFGTPTPGPGSNSFGTPTPGPGSNSFGTPTPAPGSNSFGTPTPGPGSNSFGTPTPAPGSNSFGTPTPGPGSNSFGTPTPGPGSNSFGTPTPGPGSNSFGTPTPGPGSNSFGTPTPAPGSNSFGTPTPGPGSNSFGTPTPAPGSNSFGTPTPGPGSNSFGTPTPGPGSNSFGTPTPAPGSNSFGTPTPGPGSNSFGTPTPAPGSNSFGTPTPGPGSNSFGTPTPGPGSNSFGTPTPGPGSNSFETPTPAPGANSFGTPVVYLCVDDWSPWVNRDTPVSGGGDFEKMSSDELSQFCPGGRITDIDCVESDTGDSWVSLSEASCTVGEGLACANLPFPGVPPCRDYKIRYMCNCSASTVSTPASTQSGETTASYTSSSLRSTSVTDAITTTPVVNSPVTDTVCIPGWSSWINNDSPVVGGGDFEKLTTEELFKLCPHGDVTDIDCVEADTGDSWISLAEATCTLEDGLVCSNLPFPGVPPCRDYKIRYMCNCSESTVSTPASTQSGETTASYTSSTLRSTSVTDAIPTTPVVNSPVTDTVCIPGWSSWINNDSPVVGGGDFEKLTTEELFKLCPHGDVTDIDCVEADTGDSWVSLAEATCTLEDGLDCSNLPFPGVPPCRDYKIRYMCNCSDSMQTTPPGPPPPRKINVQCDWSPWLSVDNPYVGTGDIESISELKNVFGVCSTIADIQCRVANSPVLFSQSGQDRLACDILNGFRCYNSEQTNRKCLDYEVRLLCWDSLCPGPPPNPPTMEPMTTLPSDQAVRTTASCPPGEEWQNCAYTCDEVCDYFGRSSGYCNGYSSTGTAQDCIPGCRAPPEAPRVTCQPDERLIDEFTCVPKALCTCIKPDGTPAKAFETWENPERSCSVCSCFNGEIICSIEGCVTTPPPPGMTAAPPPQVCGWSYWINDNSPTPGSGGDLEILSMVGPRHGLCANPSRIECRDISTNLDAASSGQVVTCDLVEGFKCYDYQNTEPCHDYEISVFCNCLPTPAPGKETFGTPTPAPGSNSFGTPTPGPGSNSFGTPTPGPGSNSFGTPTPAPGSNSFGTPTPGPGSNSFGTPTLGPGSNSFGTPTPGPGSNSFGTPTPAPGSNSFGTPTPGPGSNSFGTPTPAPGSNSFGTPTPGPGSNSFGTPTPAPGSNSFGTPTPGPGSNSFGTPTPAPGSNGFNTPVVAQCVEGWSPWINRDVPSTGDGDFEKMLPEELSAFCPDGEVMEIDCVESDTGDSWISLAEATCTLEEGLMCTNLPFPGVPPCRDYKIRYRCECSVSTQASKPSTTVSAPLTTKPVVSVTPESTTTKMNTPVTDTMCVPGWSAWINNDSPTSGGGDFEQLTPDELSKLCPHGDVTEIDCVESDTGDSWISLAEATCTLEDGLKCANLPFTGVPPCRDYKIRYMCNCSVSMQTAKPSTTVSAPLTTKPVVSVTPESPTTKMNTPVTDTMCVPGWSGWINNDSPTSGGGDFEQLTPDDLSKMCPHGYVTDIDCVESDTGDSWISLAEATCTLEDGLKCANLPFTGVPPCRDYKIRYMCNCSGSSFTSQAPSLTTSPTSNECKWSPWMSSQQPGALGEEENIMQLRTQYSFCPTSEITAVECRDTASKKTAADLGQVNVLCDLQYEGVKCFSSDQPEGQCADYEVRFFCEPRGVDCGIQQARTTQQSLISTTPNTGNGLKESTPRTSSQPSTSKPQATPMPDVACISGWSRWINQDSPLTGGGDYEKISTTMLVDLCPGGDLTDIDCVESDTGDSWISLAEATCTLEDGLECTNLPFPGVPPCRDYKIRYMCNCTDASSLLNTEPPKGQTSPSPVQSNTGQPTVISETPPSTKVSISSPVPSTLPPSSAQCIPGWSPWINRDTPLSGDGDIEKMSNVEQSTFCPGGEVTDIDCVEADTGDSWISLAEATCTLEDGLECTNLPFPGVPPCRDYKIRYMCNCSKITQGRRKRSAEHFLAPNAVPTSNSLGSCQSDMGLRDRRVRSSMITASSFRDMKYTPHTARLGSMGTWIPAEDDKNQYIQVDFLVPVYLTGVTTQGQANGPSHVTSFKVMHSQDGKTWSVYRDTVGVDKVFSANTDSITPVTNLFGMPIWSRYLQINPQSWYGKIALRLEIQGCPQKYPAVPGGHSLKITPDIKSSVKDLNALGNCLEWDKWVDIRRPSLADRNDVASIDELADASPVCKYPIAIECRTAGPNHQEARDAGQKAICNLWDGLSCNATNTKHGICFNYEVRLGCMRNTPECVNETPMVAKTPVCHQEIDPSKCPKHGCSKGLFCNGHKCVPKRECPCLLEGNFLKPGGVHENSKCETCQCLGGQTVCLPKQRPICPKGQPVLDMNKCSYSCKKCNLGQHQCGEGVCIPAHKRCDGIIDCLDDELGCSTIPVFNPWGQYSVAEQHRHALNLRA